MSGLTRAGMDKRGGMAKVFWTAVYLLSILAVAGCAGLDPGALGALGALGSGYGYGGMEGPSMCPPPQPYAVDPGGAGVYPPPYYAPQPYVYGSRVYVYQPPPVAPQWPAGAPVAREPWLDPRGPHPGHGSQQALNSGPYPPPDRGPGRLSRGADPRPAPGHLHPQEGAGLDGRQHGRGRASYQMRPTGVPPGPQAPLSPQGQPRPNFPSGPPAQLRPEGPASLRGQPGTNGPPRTQMSSRPLGQGGAAAPPRAGPQPQPGAPPRSQNARPPGSAAAAP